MNFSQSIKIAVAGALALSTSGNVAAKGRNKSQKREVEKPNVVFIYADDLGRGMLSHYGQKYVSTPNIDRLFEEGTSFSHANGCLFSAPSRASLLTGYHDCHGDKWKQVQGAMLAVEANEIESKIDSLERVVNSRHIELAEGDLLLSQVFKRAGYTTGQVGKLEWGFTTTRQQMKAHEWDYFYGYLDHVRCHGFYPPFLFENEDIVMIPGNTQRNCGKAGENETAKDYAARWNKSGKTVYSQDLFLAKMLEFIEENQNEPFFLYHPTQLPHGPVSVPTVHPDFAQRGDITELEKEYLTMVKMLDDHVGVVVEHLKKLGLYENTIIIFSSDNGHETYYTVENRCRKFPLQDMEGNRLDEWEDSYTSERVGDLFDGNNGMKGKKWSNYQGGVNVPLVFSWKGHIEAGKTSDQLVANYDLLPTFADILGVELTTKKDGESLKPILLDGKNELTQQRFVHVNSPIGNSVLDSRGWKLRYNKKLNAYKLFNLNEDYTESNPLNEQYPQILEELKGVLIH